MKRNRNSRPLILSTLVILFLSGIDSYSQDRDPLEERVSIQFEKFMTAFPQEKIYLHLDKPYYIPGETIWYKAYLVNARGNVPSSESGIIYAELIDLCGKVLIRQILKAKNGFANGEFVLSGFLAQGKYRVKAYTNLMRNFDQDFFFTKEVSIYDPYEEYDKIRIDSFQRKIDLQFFPEGGSLVSGLTSKVAFKAINDTGKGVFVRGEITDQDGHVVIPFESFHLGMGVFVLKPEKGKIYVANLVLKNGKRIKYELPTVLEEGVVMTVDNSPGEVVRINVQANKALLNDQTGRFVLVARSGAQIHKASNCNIDGVSSFSTDIPKRDLPTGISQITLFNAQGDPLCERLIFVNHHDALRVNIEADKKSYGPREKVQFSVSVSDVHGNPVEGNFSMAVTDLAQVAEPGKENDNILSHLLLTSELRGNIEQAGYYFIDGNPHAETALDVLMLSQGWRRFSWTDILNNHLPIIYYATEKDHFERMGRLLEDSSSAPGVLLRALFLQPGEDKAYSRFPDENGLFPLTVDAAFGKAYLFYDVDDTNGQRSVCKIEFQHKWPIYESMNPKEIAIPGPEMRDYLERRAFQSKIESSYGFSAGKALPNNPDSLGIDRVVGPCFHVGETDNHFRLDKYNAFTSMAELFREVVHYVSYIYKKKGDEIRVYSPEQMKSFDHQPLFFIDDVPTYKKTFVLNLKPEDVESIGVINASRKLRQFGFLGMNGVVAVYTKSGNTKMADIADQHMLEFQGCNHPREFYSPVYGISSETDRSKPDLRSLLYWNPTVQTDSSGEASLSFYNSDNITTIGLRLEGLSYLGTPGFADYIYKIIPERLLP